MSFINLNTLKSFKISKKIESWKDVLIHFGIVLGIGIIMIWIFFSFCLPAITNHGETLTVPDLRELTLKDLNSFLDSRHLRYEVTADSGFSASLPPLTVLKQFPQPKSKVKENRIIYVTLNAEHPPMIKMPKLVGGSLKNAQLIMKTYDLKLGKIEYIPDAALNYIFEQHLNGRQIAEGAKVAKGSVIDLVVGDGLGARDLKSPNLIGLDEESAQIAIVGSGLKVGEIHYDKEGTAVLRDENSSDEKYYRKKVAPGSVYRQLPEPGDPMELEEFIELWIYQPDSVSTGSNLLGN